MHPTETNPRLLLQKLRDPRLLDMLEGASLPPPPPAPPPPALHDFLIVNPAQELAPIEATPRTIPASPRTAVHRARLA